MQFQGINQTSERKKKCILEWTRCKPLDRSPPGSLSMGFPRQEYWSVLPFPSPGNLPDPGIKLRFPALPVDPLPSEKTLS